MTCPVLLNAVPDANALLTLCQPHILQVERQQWQITEMQAAAAEVAAHHAATRSVRPACIFLYCCVGAQLDLQTAAS